jgi:general secretion pathway protein I
LSRSIDPAQNRNDAGFTLIEALVALAVVAISLAAIGSLIGGNIRATRSLDQRLALVETTRTILAGLPDRAQLKPGNLSGEIADRRWRLDVMPFEADFVDPGLITPWFPEAVILRVQSPTGEILRIDTVRLRRGQGDDRGNEQ